MANEKLKNLGVIKGTNHFTGAAMEFIVPNSTQVIFVGDLFADEYSGGAELTSEAIITKSPYRVHKVHSRSLTPEMVERNKDKYFIISNFVMADPTSLSILSRGGYRYSVIEFDYKYCSFRSEKLHRLQANVDQCWCPLQPHGVLVEELFNNAEKIFWMSEAQKSHTCSRLPTLLFADQDKHVVLSSVFQDSHIDKLLEISASRNPQDKLWAIQGSSNWIKGTDETMQYAKTNNMYYYLIGNMSYDQFLTELSKCHGLIFHPLDFDTCPRVVIEAKIMGLNLDLNENVQHKDETWFNGSIEQCVQYLRSRGEHFWNNIKV